MVEWNVVSFNAIIVGNTHNGKKSKQHLKNYEDIMEKMGKALLILKDITRRMMQKASPSLFNNIGSTIIWRLKGSQSVAKISYNSNEGICNYVVLSAFAWNELDLLRRKWFWPPSCGKTMHGKSIANDCQFNLIIVKDP